MVGSRVYIGGLPYGTTERDVERFFRGYGRMRDVLIKSGYGFVEFDDHRDADDAVYELNGKRILGERVTVERARGTPRGRDQWSNGRGGGGRGDRDRGDRGDRDTGRDRYGPPQRTAHRLVVENLSSKVSWQDLKDYMRQAGEVTYADAHRQRRNEGVVEFASHSDMKNAIEKLDDTELNGRRIKLVEDKSAGKKSRRDSGSDSSRSRSRSKSRGSKSKSRSRSKSKEAKASRSPSRSRRSEKRSRSRSASKEAKRSRDDRSRSRSRDVRSRDERSKSRDRSKSKENGRSGSRSASRGRSASREASKERSRSPRSKSRSRSKSN